MESNPAQRGAFRFRHGVSAVGVLVCLAGVVLATGHCASMAGMGGTPMPGGWTLSMAWTRMCGQSWPQAAGSFLGMWMAMTVAMMAPVLGRALWRYGRCVRDASTARAGALAVVAAGAYLFVWGVTGLAVYTAGAWLALTELQWPSIARLVPPASALLLALAGALQFSAWKQRQLGHCRDACSLSTPRPAGARGAWRHGWRLGWHCTVCCAPLTGAMLALGVMDPRVLFAMAVAVAAERVTPAARCFARLSGTAMLAAGLMVASAPFA